MSEMQSSERQGAPWPTVALSVALVRRARRVVLPRRRAGGDAADDRAVAGDLLVALAVAELVAADAPAVADGARAPAGALRGAGGVAVDDVAGGAAAVGGVVGLPPAGDEAARRAAVATAVDRAAEGGPAVEQVPQIVGVRAAGLEDELQRVDRQRRPDDRDPGEERRDGRGPAAAPRSSARRRGDGGRRARPTVRDAPGDEPVGQLGGDHRVGLTSASMVVVARSTPFALRHEGGRASACFAEHDVAGRRPGRCG